MEDKKGTPKESIKKERTLHFSEFVIVNKLQNLSTAKQREQFEKFNKKR